MTKPERRENTSDAISRLTVAHPRNSASPVVRLVAEDREDLVRELADRFNEEALRLIVASRR